jgi:hypothetical protein
MQEILSISLDFTTYRRRKYHKKQFNVSTAATYAVAIHFFLETPMKTKEQRIVGLLRFSGKRNFKATQ